MKRRDFLKFSSLSLCTFLPSVGAVNDSDENNKIPNTLGIMRWSNEFIREIFHINIPNEEVIERGLLWLGFPEDTRVIKVFQKSKDIPFGITRIMISQKGLPKVYEGCEIPLINPVLQRIDGLCTFKEWDISPHILECEWLGTT